MRPRAGESLDEARRNAEKRIRAIPPPVIIRVRDAGIYGCKWAALRNEVSTGDRRLQRSRGAAEQLRSNARARQCKEGRLYVYAS